jgi:hypothetical protein
LFAWFAFRSLLPLRGNGIHRQRSDTASCFQRQKFNMTAKRHSLDNPALMALKKAPSAAWQIQFGSSSPGVGVKVQLTPCASPTCHPNLMFRCLLIRILVVYNFGEPLRFPSLSGCYNSCCPGAPNPYKTLISNNRRSYDLFRLNLSSAAKPPTCPSDNFRGAFFAPLSG